MWGVLVNVVALIAGALVGLGLGRFFNERLQEISKQATGLAIVGMGIVTTYDGLSALGISQLGSFSTVVFAGSLAVGGIIGELLRLDYWLSVLGNRLQDRFAKKSTDGKFARAFVNASLVMSIGAMGAVGSIQSGLGDPSTLYLKAILDAIIALIMASSMGVGVAFAALPLGIIQGLIALLAVVLSPFIDAPVIAGIQACGGLLIAAVGIGLLEIKEFKVINMVPALIVIAVVASIWG